jgi:hypothetical protein
MDNLTTMGGAITHKVEIYTNLLALNGTIRGPFKRTSDLLNWNDLQFLSVLDATITPIGQTHSQRVQNHPAYVGRSQVHFVTDLGADAASVIITGPLDDTGYRESAVRKERLQCYAITGSYIIHAHCHLLAGGSLENLLVGNEDFIPLTDATIHNVARSTPPWERDVVIVNRNHLVAMYLAQ